MKRIFMFLLLIIMFALTSCGLSETQYYINDVVNGVDETYQVLSVEDTSKIECKIRVADNVYDTKSASTQNNFIVVRIKITNNSKFTQLYSLNDFKLLNKEKTYQYDRTASSYANSLESIKASFNLETSASFSFKLAYEVPSKSSVDTYSLKLGYDTVTLTNRPLNTTTGE